ncbi:hypothetical protein DAEQUDRAFT_720600 [Daedalea quercina L-15889]|uniref:Transcription elongation factor Eaf N-terminal domain-containing protein n=1 Tax=Daedalea quercina L-15889 TaxID=1314783 RepID=A0A165U5N9_9APHY|nr:hypothetical protein DAEQUDRAFT_720600 [Daedalea quercina L-15889]
MATTWMPPPGRHSVQIGQSLGRALKARRGEPVHQKSKIPDKEFYSFRYNFKPGGVDSTKPGSVEIRKSAESTNIVVDRGSERPDEGYLFQGREVAAPEWDCILIYDEETGRYTLEKLDTYYTLTFDRKTSAPRHAPSPAASTGPGTPSAPSHVAAPRSSSRPSPPKPVAPERKPRDDLDFDLENALLAGLDDADGSPDEEVPLAATMKAKKAAAPAKPPKAKAPPKAMPRKEEEEESDGEILEAVEASSKQKPKSRPEPALASSAQKAKAASVRRPANGLPAQPVTAAEPPALKARPLSASKAKATDSTSKKRSNVDVEEETFDIALPSPPAKRPRPSSPQPFVIAKQKQREERASFSLALPTPAPAPTKAEPPTPLSFPGAATAVTLPGSSASGAAPTLDSDEEQWVEVEPSVAAAAPVPASAPPAPLAPVRVIEMEEIVPTSSPRRPSPPLALDDADAEGDEDDEMEEVEVPYEGEDFLAAAVSPVQETAVLPGVESGNDLFGEGDDEEYSSSEDSDED